MRAFNNLMTDILVSSTVESLLPQSRCDTNSHHPKSLQSKGRIFGSLQHLKHSLFSKRFFIFRERGREGEREGNVHVWLPLKHPLLGTWPTTQACALTRNRTSNPLILRLALSPLSHTSQGINMLLERLSGKVKVNCLLFSVYYEKCYNTLSIT